MTSQVGPHGLMHRDISASRGTRKPGTRVRFACPNLLPYPGPVAKTEEVVLHVQATLRPLPDPDAGRGRLEPDQAKKIFSKARNKKALKKAKLKKAKLAKAA